MLILLPPSEGKTSPRSGAPLDLDTLLFPTLAGERRTVLGTLTTASALPDALSVLGVGASLEDEVRANVDLLEAHAAPGHQVYSGVLFDALDSSSLSDGARTDVVRLDLPGDRASVRTAAVDAAVDALLARLG